MKVFVKTLQLSELKIEPDVMKTRVQTLITSPKLLVSVNSLPTYFIT
jgi:hypothetical protein